MGGWWVEGGGSLQTPIHMEKQLKNLQSNWETTPPPGRKRQKLKNQESGGRGGVLQGRRGWGRVRGGKLKSEVIWLEH